jgi:hypothetical protein
MSLIESVGFSNGMALPQKLRSDVSGCVFSWVSCWGEGRLSNGMVVVADAVVGERQQRLQSSSSAIRVMGGS